MLPQSTAALPLFDHVSDRPLPYDSAFYFLPSDLLPRARCSMPTSNVPVLHHTVRGRHRPAQDSPVFSLPPADSLPRVGCLWPAHTFHGRPCNCQDQHRPAPSFSASQLPPVDLPSLRAFSEPADSRRVLFLSPLNHCKAVPNCQTFDFALKDLLSPG